MIRSIGGADRVERDREGSTLLQTPNAILAQCPTFGAQFNAGRELFLAAQRYPARIAKRFA